MDGKQLFAFTSTTPVMIVFMLEPLVEPKVVEEAVVRFWPLRKVRS